MHISQVPPAIRCAYFVDAGFAIAFVVDRTLGCPLGDLFSQKFLDLDGERNLPTWYSSQKLFLIGALFLLAAWTCQRERMPKCWLLAVLGAGFLGLSADEFIGLHEQLAFRIDGWLLAGGHRTATVFHRTGIWMFVLIVPVLAVLLAAVAAFRRLWSERGVTGLLSAGLVICFGGAFSDVLINFVSGYHAKTLQVTLEEFLEMAGATTILWGIHRMLSSRGFFR